MDIQVPWWGEKSKIGHKINITISITGYLSRCGITHPSDPGLQGSVTFDILATLDKISSNPFFLYAQVFLLSSFQWPCLLWNIHLISVLSSFLLTNCVLDTFGTPELHFQIIWHLNVNTFTLLCLSEVVKFYINLLIAIFLLNIFVFYCY